jgi:hypothetical protein
MLVMGQAQDLLGEFPAELAERLQRMADVQTAGTSPWPGVDQAVQRAHRRRVAGVATLAAASVLVVGLAAGGLLDPGSNHSQSAVPIATTPPAPTTTTTTTSTGTSGVTKAVRLKAKQVQAVYTGAIGGSLAKDRAWQAALRTAVAKALYPDSPQSVEILLLWAGDLNGSRYAVMLGNAGSDVFWMPALGVGPVGARPGQMKVDWKPEFGAMEAEADFEKSTTTTAPFAGTVFVKAPSAATIEVATARRFGPDGTITTTWRPLQKQGGSVWVGQLNAAELHLSDYRVNGTRSGGPGTQRVGETRGEQDGFPAVAAPGTDLETAQLADDWAQGLGASPEERAVLSASIPLGGKNTLAAAVLRSPDGGYLFGLAERHFVERTRYERTSKMLPGSRTLLAGAISRQPFADAEKFMAAVQVPGTTKNTPRHPRRHYLVIAPAGADRIRIQGLTAKVTNRLAILDFPSMPDNYSLGNRVEALNRSGSVIGTVTAFNGYRGASATEKASVSVLEAAAVHPYP